MTYTGGNKEEGSSKSSNKLLIIVATCGGGGVVVIAVIIIWVVLRCKRSTPDDCNSLVGDAMPDEGGGSKREQCELKLTDAQGENICLVEDKGISNQGMDQTTFWYLNPVLFKHSDFLIERNTT